MHIEAYEGFARMLTRSGWYDSPITGVANVTGLDVGGADVNGSVRAQLPEVTWTGLDIEPAPGVNIVANAATWDPTESGGFDIVIATELFEHTSEWREIIRTMAHALRNDGPQVLIATCASIGRPPHGARGEWGVPDDQFYRNVEPGELLAELEKYFIDVHVEYNPNPGDAYAWARGVK